MLLILLKVKSYNFFYIFSQSLYYEVLTNPGDGGSVREFVKIISHLDSYKMQLVN